MTDLNSVIIAGRLTDDGKLTYTKDGTAIESFTIAVNSAVKDSKGEWSDVASFFDCSYVSKRAESINQYMLKGRGITVEGSLSQRRWKDKNGENRSRVGIRVKNIFLSTVEASKKESSPKKTSGKAEADYEPMDDDNIPF